MTGTRPILSPPCQAALAEAERSRLLLAFDYDGTLAPIAAEPADAHMRSRTRRLLGAAARLYPTVVISGRALRDVTTMLQRVPLWCVYGNHGLEPLRPDVATRAEVWAHLLRARLPHVPGLLVEDKGHSLTVHFRDVPDRARVLPAIEAAVRALPEACVLQGRDSINVLPHGAGNKGGALLDAMAVFQCERAIYVGDEETDEDAFAAGEGLVLSIRVEPSPLSHAAYHLGTQLEIDRLLRLLVNLRRPPRRAR